MSAPLTRYLSRYAELAADECHALDGLSNITMRSVRARKDVFREGDPCSTVSILASGWACQSKLTENGSRQIIAFLLPGEMCDPQAHLLGIRDTTLNTLTDAKLITVRAEVYEGLTERYPRIALALRRADAFVLAATRERLLSIGRRPAYARLGLLFTDLMARAKRAGVGDGRSCDFPLRQIDMADACGLTPVHVNRTLQEMRRAGVIDLCSRRLTILRPQELRFLSTFAQATAHDPLNDNAAPWERNLLPIAG